MNYYKKIAAYFEGKMSVVERQVFEQELEENVILQKEMEAYELAQNLFNFSATNLSEREIISTSATESAEEIIQFTAKHLSEAKILAIGSSKKSTIIERKLHPSFYNRSAWLVAASMLIILSVIGNRFYNNQDSLKTIGNSQPAIVETPSIEVLQPENKQVIPATNNIQESPLKVIAQKKPKSSKPKYESARVKITKKNKKESFSEPIKDLSFQNTPTKTTSNNLIALYTTAQKIISATQIASGQSVVYKAEKTIILKTGFHAKAGAEFTAAPIKNEAIPSDLTLDGTYDGNVTNYNASNTIILKPGFHAKAGMDFTASTNTPNALQEVSSNTIISDKESVIIKANNTVILRPGFHAKAGASFVAEVGK